MRKMAALRKKSGALKPGDVMEVMDYQVRITDGNNFYMQYKDEFINRIYQFDTQTPNPLIIDGGGNMGVSILHFKHIYPHARIIGFEPDPSIFCLLSENMALNNITDVQLINAGLAGDDGETFFVPDSQAGGQLSCTGTVKVKMMRLSRYLSEPVDFLKLNIEGSELDVLTEVAEAGCLRNVRELVLEYHGWPQHEQKLGKILNLLDEQGYRYLVHDFDAETCPASKPPFRLSSNTTWFCLVYAKRNDLLNGFCNEEN
jgi:FkbM family methyltransferase